MILNSSFLQIFMFLNHSIQSNTYPTNIENELFEEDVYPNISSNVSISSCLTDIQDSYELQFNSNCFTNFFSRGVIHESEFSINDTDDDGSANQKYQYSSDKLENDINKSISTKNLNLEQNEMNFSIKEQNKIKHTKFDTITFYSYLNQTISNEHLDSIFFSEKPTNDQCKNHGHLHENKNITLKNGTTSFSINFEHDKNTFPERFCYILPKNPKLDNKVIENEMRESKTEYDPFSFEFCSDLKSHNSQNSIYHITQKMLESYSNYGNDCHIQFKSNLFRVLKQEQKINDENQHLFVDLELMLDKQLQKIKSEIMDQEMYQFKHLNSFRIRNSIFLNKCCLFCSNGNQNEFDSLNIEQSEVTKLIQSTNNTFLSSKIWTLFAENEKLFHNCTKSLESFFNIESFKEQQNILYDVIEIINERKIRIHTKIKFLLIHNQYHEFVEDNIAFKAKILPELYSIIYLFLACPQTKFYVDNRRFLLFYYTLVSLNNFFNILTKNNEIKEMKNNISPHNYNMVIQIMTYISRIYFIQPMMFYLNVHQISQSKYKYIVALTLKNELNIFLKKKKKNGKIIPR